MNQEQYDLERQSINNLLPEAANPDRAVVSAILFGCAILWMVYLEVKKK